MIFKLIPEQWHPAIRSLCYYGNRYVCPCCGGRFRKFLPYGVRKRPNVKCPRCGSLERHRLIWLYLKNRTNLFTSSLMVLHFAPEDIFQRHFRLLSNLNYVSADLYPSKAMLKMDITNIYFKDNTFDVILCSHVLEHIVDDRKAMLELFRVLKPGGWSILQVPIREDLNRTLEGDILTTAAERERIFGQSDHVRQYGLDYKDRLEEVGFKVKVDNYGEELGQELFEKYGLLERHVYFCSKS